ncbi:DUF5675 family protein [Flavobacterium sp. Arc2]|uniref:DUF5675 family protein n=1 Tax=Flavobacterium sp. Arc2 TaxID=3046685 RepID=UPI00352D511D
MQNQRWISCIPEGEYVLQKWFSPKFKWHIHLQNVPRRDFILIHPANDAKKELLGCIAPVTIYTRIGKGQCLPNSIRKAHDIGLRCRGTQRRSENKDSI